MLCVYYINIKDYNNILVISYIMIYGIYNRDYLIMVIINTIDSSN